MTTEPAKTNEPLALKSNLVLGPDAEAVERPRFEAWMDGLQFNLRRHVDRPHQYANASVQGRWVTWQSAAKDMSDRLRPLTFCGCGDGFTAHDPGTCGACVAGLTCNPGA